MNQINCHNINTVYSSQEVHVHREMTACAMFLSSCSALPILWWHQDSRLVCSEHSRWIRWALSSVSARSHSSFSNSRYATDNRVSITYRIGSMLKSCKTVGVLRVLGISINFNMFWSILRLSYNYPVLNVEENGNTQGQPPPYPRSLAIFSSLNPLMTVGAKTAKTILAIFLRLEHGDWYL